MTVTFQNILERLSNFLERVMNIPVNTINTPRQEVAEVKELIGSLWNQRAIVLLFTALTVTAAITYTLLATPEYEAETYVRPVPLADLDELNESGLYKLLPKDALNNIGSSMQSYDVRLKFFQANPQYLAPLQAPGQTIESTFEKFNEKAFSLEKVDPKKAPAFPKRLALASDTLKVWMA